MKNHILYRYDWGWDAFEKVEIAQDYKEERGKVPTDDELNEYIDFIQSNNWDDMMSEIDCYEKHHGVKNYVILARIGTWRGTFDSALVCNGMKEVIFKCCDSCDYITIAYKNNQLKIIGHHHDGTNTFVIRELTQKGTKYYHNRWFDSFNYDLCKKLFKSTRLSHMVSIFPKIYGWV